MATVYGISQTKTFCCDWWLVLISLLQNRLLGAGKIVFLGANVVLPLAFAATNDIFKGGSRHDPSLKIDF